LQLKREKIDTTHEKNIIIGCVVSDKFIKDYNQLVGDFSLFESNNLRIIGSWCLRYFEKYKKAPKELIGNIFEVEKENLKEDQIQYIDRLLTHLSETYIDSEFNADYFLANAKKYIDERNIMQMAEKMKGLALQGDTERAYSEIKNFKKIENTLGMGIDVLNDRDFVDEMFQAPDKDVFHIPGDLGRAIQDKYRGDVIGVGGRQKLGKSWVLMELAKYATISGCNVCYYTLEMKGSVMGKRIFKSLSGALDYNKSGEIILPYFTEESKTGKEKTKISFEYQIPENLNLQLAKKQQRMFKLAARNGGFRLFDRTTGGATMEQIEYSLENLEAYDDYVCDVAIIDYDDIVEVHGPDGRDDRSRLNHVWLYAKKIASERNMLVILASQNNRATFQRDANVDDISGDIRKFSHVSHWITLNQTPQEKKAHIMRVKVDGRHGDFNPLDEVICLQNLSIGKAVLDSRFKKNVLNYDEWVDEMNADYIS
jgi:replicative DNA helicase